MWVFGFFKLVTLLYWGGVVRTLWLSDPSAFERVLAATAPAVVSMHFLEFMLTLRVLKPERNFGRELLLTLTFGAFHIGPRLLAARAGRPR